MKLELATHRIDGWIADLIYTESGYAEPDYIISALDINALGHFTIELIDNGDGSCESHWTLTFTAVNEKGNAVIEAMPEKDPDFDTIVLGALDHFLPTGQRLKRRR